MFALSVMGLALISVPSAMEAVALYLDGQLTRKHYLEEALAPVAT